uniref:Neur_chan_LBD domain-containing protein n=1 Tax=Angiostrongylus cantonensis TaxID=6313 RepID=A0A0K0DJL9_ANGCA
MRLCILMSLSASLSYCIFIDKDYNVAMEDETTEESLLTTTSRKGYRNCTRDTAIIDKLLNGTGYNKFRIPRDDGVKVSVEFWIQAITSINEITNDFEMDIYINEMWMDSSLHFENLNPCKQNLSLNHQVLDRLWTPNSCFINSKFAEIHDSPFKQLDCWLRTYHIPSPVSRWASWFSPKFLSNLKAFIDAFRMDLTFGVSNELG